MGAQLRRAWKRGRRAGVARRGPRKSTGGRLSTLRLRRGFWCQRPTGSTAYAFSPRGGTDLVAGSGSVAGGTQQRSRHCSPRPMVTSPEGPRIAIEIEGDGHDALVFLRRVRREMLMPARCATGSAALRCVGDEMGPTGPGAPFTRPFWCANSVCRSPAGADGNSAFRRFGSSRWAPSAAATAECDRGPNGFDRGKPVPAKTMVVHQPSILLGGGPRPTPTGCARGPSGPSLERAVHHC